MSSTYTPVSYDFRETIEEEIEKQRSGKVFFWNEENKVDSVEGRVIELKEIPGQGLFITLDPLSQLRIDRIITLFGRPGAAFDEYDSFGNQCLACTGGYDL
jgi:hypothetical protein